MLCRETGKKCTAAPTNRAKTLSREQEKVKVVVCGPPHSGKSVFLLGLVGQLARRDYYLFRACPDGEGSWTYAAPGNSQLRRKGQFAPEFVQWCVRALHENSLAPCVLVDVGGRMTPENRQIMAECDSAIILSGDPAAIPNWRQFCAECGLRVIAELHSDYHASNDVVECETPLVRGSVHHLERGEDVTSRPAIEAVGRALNGLIEKEKQEKAMNENSITITIDSIAKELGKEKIKKTLPNNGKVIQTIEWQASDLVAISRLLHGRSAEFVGQDVRVDGGAPGFFVAAIVHELHPADVSVNSPDGF